MGLTKEEQTKVLVKQGRAVFGGQMKIVDPQGRALPWDGVTCGDLLVKGPVDQTSSPAFLTSYYIAITWDFCLPFLLHASSYTNQLFGLSQKSRYFMFYLFRPWVCRAYFKQPASASPLQDGW